MAAALSARPRAAICCVRLLFAALGAPRRRTRAAARSRPMSILKSARLPITSDRATL
jgi:hypothetical protein